MMLYPEIKKKGYLKDIFGNKDEVIFRENNFDLLYYHKFNTRGYQWVFARLINRGLSIVPKINLVSNIVFGKETTHTTSNKNKRANMENYDIEFPLRYTLFTIRDKKSDDRYFKKFIKPNKIQRIKRFIKKFIK